MMGLLRVRGNRRAELPAFGAATVGRTAQSHFRRCTRNENNDITPDKMHNELGTKWIFVRDAFSQEHAGKKEVFNMYKRKCCSHGQSTVAFTNSCFLSLATSALAYKVSKEDF
ncbi:hypothetical protein CEXT_314541 [Caerostris extrusa]|uniref:Uncharacterized protein n=1 Tax=Caerostris extrusa TaxID=172846 RepID=A0AAV4X1Q6_CAEEX|nr:hypothetical protein CEXT_314541 [Caerostris extrusa]